MEKYLFNFKVLETRTKQGDKVTKTLIQVNCVCVCKAFLFFAKLELL